MEIVFPIGVFDVSISILLLVLLLGLVIIEVEIDFEMTKDKECILLFLYKRRKEARSLCLSRKSILRHISLSHMLGSRAIP